MKKIHFRKIALGLLAAGTMFIISCGNSVSDDSTSDSTSLANDTVSQVNHAEAVITGTKEDTAVDGRITFDATGGEVAMDLSLTIPKMANKIVAVHIHEHPDCGDNGGATHGHWNPTNAPHGKWGVDSFHLGDIGNVQLDAQGKGTLKMSTDLWTLGNDSNSVLNHAIIVHSGVDDYTSQPSGNAGSRIGCGIIK